MQFHDFLNRDIRKFAWESIKGGRLPNAYGFGELMKQNGKNIFLTAVAQFAQEFGVEHLIKQKATIVRYAQTYEVSVLDVTKKLYTIIGDEATKQFVNKNIHLMCIARTIMLMILSFFLGAWIF